MWHAMKHKYKPWNRDVEKMVGAGLLQNKIEKEYHKRRGGRITSVNDDGDDDESYLRQEARGQIKKQYVDRLKDVYADNLAEMVTRTRRSTDSNGFIDKITCNLLPNIPFLEQVEMKLKNIFDAVRTQMPYKLTLAFGFLLYDKDNDSFNHFYITIIFCDRQKTEIFYINFLTYGR